MKEKRLKFMSKVVPGMVLIFYLPAFVKYPSISEIFVLEKDSKAAI